MSTFTLAQELFEYGFGSVYSEVFTKFIELFEISQVVAFREEDILRYIRPPYQILQAVL